MFHKGALYVVTFIFGDTSTTTTTIINIIIIIISLNVINPVQY
jgi:hypothetical protein